MMVWEWSSASLDAWVPIGAVAPRIVICIDVDEGGW